MMNLRTVRVSQRVVVVVGVLALLLPSSTAFILSFGTQGPAAPTVPRACVNTIHNCNAYDKSVCTSGQYQQWASDNCPVYCGFCQGPNTPAPPCVDKLNNCATYETATCTDPKYRPWAEDNCRQFCRIC